MSYFSTFWDLWRKTLMTFGTCDRHPFPALPFVGGKNFAARKRESARCAEGRWFFTYADHRVQHYLLATNLTNVDSINEIYNDDSQSSAKKKFL